MQNLSTGNAFGSSLKCHKFQGKKVLPIISALELLSIIQSLASCILDFITGKKYENIHDKIENLAIIFMFESSNFFSRKYNPDLDGQQKKIASLPIRITVKLMQKV